MEDTWFLIGILMMLTFIGFLARSLFDLAQTFRWVPMIDPRNDAPLPTDVPLISVIVPACNEEDVIEQCVKSVLAQDYPRFELILVDDRSTDATYNLATELARGVRNFEVLSIKDLPCGWTGKCHALDIGFQQASGEWIVFLDADTQLKRTALRQMLHLAVSRNVSMVTLVTKPVLRTFWDKALLPAFMAMSGLIFPLWKINLPSSPVASANGMCYLIRRSAYLEIGGHRGVKNLAVEDIGIGKRVKAQRLGLLFANGTKIAKTRMYEGAWAIFDGWSRIVAASMNYKIVQILWASIFHLYMSLPFMVVAFFLYMPNARIVWPEAWFLLPAVVLMGCTFLSVTYCSFIGIPKKYGFILLIGHFMLTVVFALAIKRILTKDPLTWRGTVYDSIKCNPKQLEPAPSHIEGGGEITAYSKSTTPDMPQGGVIGLGSIGSSGHWRV